MAPNCTPKATPRLGGKWENLKRQQSTTNDPNVMYTYAAVTLAQTFQSER